MGCLGKLFFFFHWEILRFLYLCVFNLGLSDPAPRRGPLSVYAVVASGIPKYLHS